MAEVGFTALPVPADYGGMGGSVVDTTILLEEIGRSSLSVASMLNFAIGFGCETVKRFGSEEQKQELLPKIVGGEMCFAFSLTEPDAGSDAAAIRTRAGAPMATSTSSTGTKIFTTGAAEARCLVVATRTDTEADRHRGISLLIVDPKSEGIACRNIEKLGMRGAGGPLTRCATTAFECPRARLLGPLNGGWDAVKATPGAGSPVAGRVLHRLRAASDRRRGSLRG